MYFFKSPCELAIATEILSDPNVSRDTDHIYCSSQQAPCLNELTFLFEIRVMGEPPGSESLHCIRHSPGCSNSRPLPLHLRPSSADIGHRHTRTKTEVNVINTWVSTTLPPPPSQSPSQSSRSPDTRLVVEDYVAHASSTFPSFCTYHTAEILTNTFCTV